MAHLAFSFVIKEGDEPKTGFYYKIWTVRISGNAFRFSKRSRPVSTDDELAFSSYDQLKMPFLSDGNQVSRDISFHQMEFQWIHQRFLLFKIGRLRKSYSRRMFHFLGDQKQEASFKKLKDAFARPGFLAHPNRRTTILYWKQMLRTLPFLEFCISTTKQNTLRPVAFYSRTDEQLPSELRHLTDKELLAVVESFKHWRHLLQGGLPSSYCLVRSQESGILYVDQETNSSDRLVGHWNSLNMLLLLLTRPGKLNGRADFTFETRRLFLGQAIKATSSESLTPIMFWIFKLQWQDLDLHVMVH
ncbi:hypothetical protein BASA83_013543 [Batrachochytrium salamandrivorans]|nr:hypothetical protein BASA83_013543 [Batrachochytrium salamandrivorans]